MFSPVALAATLASACALVAAPAAQASFPGVNGPILFSQYTAEPFPGEPNDFEVVGDLRSVMPDGTGNRVLANEEDVSENSAVASPDGRRIVYAKGPSLWTSAIDGTGPKRLTDPTQETDMPAWAPDGRSLVFVGEEGNISIIGVGTTGQADGEPRIVIPSRVIGSGPSTFEMFANPVFTPDGTALRYNRLRYHDGKTLKASTSIWNANVDGSNPSRVFRGSGDTRAVLNFDLSPDGTRIAFLASPNWKKEPRRLFVANADGSAPRLLATAAKSGSYGGVAWSPDGSSIALSESRWKPSADAQLLTIDVATGAQRTVARSAKGPIIEVSWAPQPKG